MYWLKVLFVFQVQFVKYTKRPISQIERSLYKSELQKLNANLVQNVVRCVFQAAICGCTDTVLETYIMVSDQEIKMETETKRKTNIERILGILSI